MSGFVRPAPLQAPRGETGGRRQGPNFDGEEEGGFVPDGAVFETSLPLERQRQRLPIFARRRELLHLVETHQVTVVVGQTGSGKTTQLPQYLLEAGWAANGRAIAVTQPRRVAVTAVAQRVAEETRLPLGEEVGYAVRFSEQCSRERTQVLFLTDGVLFRELLSDPTLERYNVVVVDEAHERGAYTDLLLGVLKKILLRRPDLRVVVSSATIDAARFLRFFRPLSAAAIAVEGRAFPVTDYYLDRPCADYLSQAVRTVLAIHGPKNSKIPENSDVLVFLAGREEVDRVAERLLQETRGDGTLLPLPLYAGVSAESQLRVFDPAPRGVRKVVLSTNVAETSVTIDGIAHVVDCGFMKTRVYDPRTRLESLVRVPVSKANAAQRSGRAGRTRPGSCYRLYTVEAHDALRDAEVPEIRRTALPAVVLQLKALGIDNLMHFDFVSAPPVETLARALDLLFSLGALNEHAALALPLGMRMAELPLEPQLAKVLLSAPELGVGEEVLKIAAVAAVAGGVFLPSQEVFACPLAVEEGDHLTFLNAYRAYELHGSRPSWFARMGLSYRALGEAASVFRQLCAHLKRLGVRARPERPPREEAATAIRRCIVGGYFANAALLQPDGSYRGVTDDGTGDCVLHMHPNSVLFQRTPQCVVYQDVVRTTKNFMRNVTVIEKEWLHEIAPHYYEVEEKKRKPPKK